MSDLTPKQIEVLLFGYRESESIHRLCKMAERTHDAEQRAERLREALQGLCDAVEDGVPFSEDNHDLRVLRAFRNTRQALQSAPPASEPEQCPVCEQGNVVLQEYSKCLSCGADPVLTDQIRRNEARLREAGWPGKRPPAPADRPDMPPFDESTIAALRGIHDEGAVHILEGDGWGDYRWTDEARALASIFCQQADHPEPSEALDALLTSAKNLHDSLGDDYAEMCADVIRRALSQPVPASEPSEALNEKEYWSGFLRGRSLSQHVPAVPLTMDGDTLERMTRHYIAALPEHLKPERGSGLTPYMQAMEKALAVAEPTPAEPSEGGTHD